MHVQSLSVSSHVAALYDTGFLLLHRSAENRYDWGWLTMNLGDVATWQSATELDWKCSFINRWSSTFSKFCRTQNHIMTLSFIGNLADIPLIMVTTVPGKPRHFLYQVSSPAPCFLILVHTVRQSAGGEAAGQTEHMRYSGRRLDLMRNATIQYLPLHKSGC